MAEAPKFNLRNPAVKRIMQEIKEIRQDTSGDFLAEALETDIFEWHFVIRGPRDTEFEVRAADPCSCGDERASSPGRAPR
ncbi:Ubiquitin-conjugating enzyme E2 32, partial [Tetrabaena socialis]